MCVCMCVCVCVCMCESICVCACVCVCEKERQKYHVVVCAVPTTLRVCSIKFWISHFIALGGFTSKNCLLLIWLCWWLGLWLLGAFRIL